MYLSIVLEYLEKYWLYALLGVIGLILLIVFINLIYFTFFHKKKSFVENLNDIKLAAEGNIEAFNRLQIAMSQQIILDVVGIDKFENLSSDIQESLNKIQDLDTTIKIGATFNAESDPEGF